MTGSKMYSVFSRKKNSAAQEKSPEKNATQNKAKPKNPAAALTEKVREEKLNSMRMMINQLDDMIIQTVAQRMRISQNIGALKKATNMNIKDPKREKELQNFHKELAQKYGITYPTLQKIFELVMKESKRLQK